jgi:hypothetical protein
MKRAGALLWIIAAAALFLGCTSKLVRIDSDPSFADVLVNDDHIGKTPLYYRFTDRWYPWPLEITEDYVVEARLKGYHPDTQEFTDTPSPLDVGYVPDEIFFKLTPVPVETGRDASP